MCKQSLKALLIAFVLTACLSSSTCRHFFFRLPVCECPSALSQLNFWSSVSTVRVLFHWKHCLYLNCCFAIRDSFSVCNLVPRVLSYPPYGARERVACVAGAKRGGRGLRRLERERPWKTLVTWLQNKIISEGGVLCLTFFYLVYWRRLRSDRNSKIDLLTLLQL